MPAVATQLVRTTLAASSATLYTTPASTSMIITNILLANTTTAERTVTITVAGVAAIPGMKIAANSIVAIDLRQVLSAGNLIAGFADTASAVTCHIAGVGVS